MPVKAASLPFKDIRWFHLLGWEMGAFPDGRLYVSEWVEDETDGAVQVHSDDGKDHIVEGDPTQGMLFKGAEAFVRFAEADILGRVEGHLSRQLRRGAA